MPPQPPSVLDSVLQRLNDLEESNTKLQLRCEDFEDENDRLKRRVGDLETANFAAYETNLGKETHFGEIDGAGTGNSANARDPSASRGVAAVTPTSFHQKHTEVAPESPSDPQPPTLSTTQQKVHAIAQLPQILPPQQRDNSAEKDRGGDALDNKAVEKKRKRVAVPPEPSRSDTPTSSAVKSRLSF
ncbi:MAG: hypothetical protein SGARI_001449, partial [Bacillariaceae sp.]